MIATVPIHVICPQGRYADFGWFYDQEWGIFFVERSDLEEVFGTSAVGQHALKVEDFFAGTAAMREPLPIVHWGRVDPESATLCGIESPFRVLLARQAGEVSCEICKRIAKVPAEPYEFVTE